MLDLPQCCKTSPWLQLKTKLMIPKFLFKQSAQKEEIAEIISQFLFNEFSVTHQKLKRREKLFYAYAMA